MANSNRPWTFSDHAYERSADRFNLILDEKARLEISRQLDNGATLITKKTGRHVFEFEAFGVKIVAVCNLQYRKVITLMEARRYFRKIKHGKSRTSQKKHGWKKDRFGGGPEDVG